jgi:hypothetical protein
MTTDILRVHVDEILSTIKQTFADRSVSRAQVAYAFITVGNKMLGQHIIKRDSGAFLTIFPEVPVQIAENVAVEGVVTNRKYIELPGLIFDYDKDDAIHYVAYESTGSKYELPRFSKKKMMRTEPGQAEWLLLSPYTHPSPKEPYFYRVGNLVYFLGLEKIPVKNVEMGLFLTINPLQVIDIDQPFPFPMELLSDLKRQVIDLIKFGWFFPADREITGDDESQTGKANIPKIVSVNQQEQTEQ